MTLFMTLLSSAFTLFGIGISWLWHVYPLGISEHKTLESLRLKGAFPLLAISLSLFCLGVWEPLVWQISLSFFIFWALGNFASQLNKALLNLLLVFAAIVCIPSHDPGVLLPVYGWIKLPFFFSLLIDGLAIWSALACIRYNREPEGVFCGLFFGIWSLFFLFVSHTAFGADIGWSYETFQNISAAFLGAFATLLIFNSSPAFIRIPASAAWGLTAGWAVMMTALGCPWLILVLLPLPFIRWLLRYKLIALPQKKPYPVTIFVPLLCFSNTAIAAGVLKMVHLSPLL